MLEVASCSAASTRICRIVMSLSSQEADTTDGLEMRVCLSEVSILQSGKSEVGREGDGVGKVEGYL